MPREKRCRSTHRIRDLYGNVALRCTLRMGHEGRHEDHSFEPPAVYAWSNYNQTMQTPSPFTLKERS